MPASQKTPNYQLPVYAEDDITSYLQDYNPAMQKIDAQMKANADAAAAAQSDADSLDTRVTALEDAPAGVTELNSDTDVTGFENGYILINNNGKLGAIEPSGGTGTDPNAIHASGGGTFSASEGIGTTGPYNIVVDEEPAGVPITSDDVTIPESASAFGGQTVTEALESLSEGESSGAAAENVSYNNASSGLTATNVQEAIDEIADTPFYYGFYQISSETSGSNTFGSFIVMKEHPGVDSCHTSPIVIDPDLLESGNKIKVVLTFFGKKPSTIRYCGFIPGFSSSNVVTGTYQEGVYTGISASSLSASDSNIFPLNLLFE